METLRGTTARVIAISGMIAAVHTSATATEFRLCIGEYEGGCFSAHERYEYCGASPDVVAARICNTVIDNKGQPVPYHVTLLNDRGGNKCGYSLYRVECLDKKP
jgi:hypothetical protein